MYLKGDYPGAIDRAGLELASQPDFWQGHWLVCLSRSAMGHNEAAVADCERAATLSSRTPMALGMLGYLQAEIGDRQRAEVATAELTAMRNRQYVGPVTIAIIHGALGQLDRAFHHLETAYRERDQLLIHIDNYRFFDPLRHDPRFDGLRNRIIRGS